MCENINDLNLQIEKSQIWSIDEECTSNLSADLTNAKILNYLKIKGNKIQGEVHQYHIQLNHLKLAMEKVWSPCSITGMTQIKHKMLEKCLIVSTTIIIKCCFFMTMLAVSYNLNLNSEKLMHQHSNDSSSTK